ncbi:MAG TPA: class D sortase [Vicinamibacterales bacterium]
MQDTRSRTSVRHGNRLLRCLAYLFVMAGGAALGWYAAMIADGQIAQWVARQQLESTRSDGNTSLNQPYLPLSKRSLVIPENGTPLAELSIPRIGLSVVVLQGSDEHTLRQGVGHIESTALPGESGNVGIAGHRDSFFRPLRNVQVGDDIMLETPAGNVHYRVSSYRIVSPSEVSVIHPTSDPVLTLVTCYPFYFVGAAPDRFVVRANLVDDR